MEEQAMFMDAGQAMHFAFLMEEYEASPECMTWQAIRTVLKMLGLREKLEAMVGRTGTVNFSGLSPLEIRGQCQMIRSSIVNRLHPAESAAMLARYTLDPLVKARAIRFLSEYIFPVGTGSERLLYDYCVLSCFSKREMEKGQRAELLERLGVKPKSAAGFVRTAKRRVREYERRAEERMQDVFEQGGLVSVEAA